jgi:hypothetical protein
MNETDFDLMIAEPQISTVCVEDKKGTPVILIVRDNVPIMGFDIKDVELMLTLILNKLARKKERGYIG